MVCRYFVKSLKNLTRQHRGEGNRTKVAQTSKIPRNWENFLRLSENKVELFHLLAKSIATFSVAGVALCATLDENVITSPVKEDVSAISPCNHEEADTRIFLHVADAVKEGHSKLMVRASDTDVIVLAISCVHKISGLDELWIHIRSGKNRQYIAAHEVAEPLGMQL